jgi:hypothetical protein
MHRRLCVPLGRLNKLHGGLQPCEDINNAAFAGSGRTLDNAPCSVLAVRSLPVERSSQADSNLEVAGLKTGLQTDIIGVTPSLLKEMNWLAQLLN